LVKYGKNYKSLQEIIKSKTVKQVTNFVVNIPQKMKAGKLPKDLQVMAII